MAHRGSWRRLREESCALRERGLAQGTWANKISHLKAYITFTSYYGAKDFLVQLPVLLRFMALLARGTYAYRSATNMLGSLRWFSALLDPSSDKVFNAALVSVSMRGMKAKLSRPVRQKLPISVSHLEKFYYILDLSNIKHLACWCSMLLAFFGCFRLSNLVPTSKNSFDPLKHLTRADVRFEGKFVLIFYKYSKTNQNSDRVSWIPICSVADSRFNPQLHLKTLLAIVKVHPDAPLFTFHKSNFHTRYSLTRLLDHCLFVSGLSLSDFSWHSFRRGATVFAFELGLADSAVQLLGDWSSPAFKRYLEFTFVRKISVAKKISKSFDIYVSNV